MPQIYFWNAQHLTTNAEALAHERELAETQAKQSEIEQIANSKVATPRITRQMMHSRNTGGRGGKPAKKAAAAKKAAVMKRVDEVAANLDRPERIQLAIALSMKEKINRLEAKARVARSKVETEQFLSNQGVPVFYCEVQQAYVGMTSSLRDVVPPGNHTLCYLKVNAPGAFVEPLNFPGHGAGGGVLGPPGGPHLTLASHRIPRTVLFNGVNLFFWHAPSPNNGQVVAAVWAFLKAQYPANTCILFGDFNAEPGEVHAGGAPLGEIVVPTGGKTHDKGKILDYALSTVPNVSVSRAFRPRSPGDDICRDFGSDHAAMRVHWR